MAASDTARATIRDMTTATAPLRELLAEAFPDATELDVQHRLVYAALEHPLADGTIHELRISTKGP